MRREGSKKRQSSRDAFARDLALKIRYTLKKKAPLSAAQNNVVRQRSTVHREERFKRLIEFLGFCSTTRNLSLVTVSKIENDDWLLPLPSFYTLSTFSLMTIHEDDVRGCHSRAYTYEPALEFTHFLIP